MRRPPAADVRGHRLRRHLDAAGAGLYAHPHSVADIVEHTTGRALDLLDVETDAVTRWTGERNQDVVVHLP
ncbi:hypothetical protein HBB16_04000 [Pseudonocardia sp. MCCB 268]|nr:hypothetical protein [Pseudonocardia cytotoxica]